jgi:ribonuclease HI
VDEFFRRLAEALGAPAPAAPPPSGAAERAADVVLNIDGGSSGNPGPAGIGVVLSLPEGGELEAWGGFIGRATSNVAEYRALLAGLERAIELGAHTVQVRCDSELLVRQINGQYKVRNADLAGLHAQAAALLRRFDNWTVRHVRRGQNSRADALAQQAIRQGRPQ